MLTLTRELNESLFIGDDIEVIVTRIGNKSIRLSIRAPKDVAIVRAEAVNKEGEHGRKNVARG